MSGRFTETLHEDYAQSLGVTEVLYDNNSSLQHIQVFENGRFGRVLTLDGVVQTTEGDEGDCDRGDKGSFRVGEPALPHLKACVDACKGCTRCRYVSFSTSHEDCSWFHSCDLGRLHVGTQLDWVAKAFTTVRVKE